MKKIKTMIKPTEIFLIPTIGWLMQYDYGREKKYLRIAFAWLCFRASVIIWEGKMNE
jgi:hypothetical protein